MAVKMWTLVFREMMLRALVGGYQCLGGIYCLHLQGTQPRGPQFTFPQL